MNKELKAGILATAFLAVTIGGQVLSTKTITDNQTHLAMKERATQVQLHNQTLATQKQLYAQVVQAKYPQQSAISENFKIVGFEDTKNGKFVRGEKIDGTGEGIYYLVDDFKRFGLGDVKKGDAVTVSWTQKDYTEENWDHIAMISTLRK